MLPNNNEIQKRIEKETADLKDLNKEIDPTVLRSAAVWYKEQYELKVANAVGSEASRLQSALEVFLQSPFYYSKKIVSVVLKKGVRRSIGIVADRFKRAKKNTTVVTKPDIKLLDRMRGLEVPRDENPEVSVIIPIFNLLDMTLDCLRAIQRASDKTKIEVIVADDASTDVMIKPVMRRIPGVIYVRRATNGGFVNSCNTGAAEARGKYLYFLNNDTEVHDRWLEPLVQLIKKDRTIGAVGSKLIYPDGILQEAGGIIYDTGEGWHFGGGDDPLKPEYNFVKEVDYCSGAGLMVRRDLFNKLGGFRRELSPGYYEDTDLCFMIRELGYRVMYQPLSVVTHYEGASSDNATRKPMKAYQEINWHKFKKIHAAALAKQPKKDAEQLNIASRRLRGNRIWIFDSIIPTPDRDYGSVRTATILSTLAKNNTVTFVPHEISDNPSYRKQLAQDGVEVVVRAGANLTARLAIEGPLIDYVILMRPDVIHHFYYLVKRFCPNAKVIFDTVDLHHVSATRQRKWAKSDAEAKALDQRIAYYKALELEYSKIADAAWGITDADSKQVKDFAPNQLVNTVSVGHEVVEKVTPFERRNGLFYLGNFYHPPSVGAMEMFLEKILPIVRQKMPQISLDIVGRAAPDSLLKHRGNGVKFLGGVDDLSPLYGGSRIFVSPHIFGSGLKGKIIMAMAAGLPVITSTIGAEGIPAKSGEQIIIADSPNAFAEQVVRLYQDKDLWNKISHGGQDVIRKHFSVESLERELSSALAQVDAKVANQRAQK